MKKVAISLMGSLVLLAGCSSATTTSEDPCASTDGTYEVTLVTDSGGINDDSFNEMTWMGVQEYCALNEDVSATYIETPDPAQLETNLKTASEQSEVVVPVGFNFAYPVYNVAPMYPETQYILVDAEPTDENYNVVEMPNVSSVLFKEQEAGYLVGYIAGKTTETDKIAFIGGQAIPTVSRFAYGFVMGAEDANPDVTINIQYSDTFTDENKGLTMADTLYGTGYDVIFTASGGVNKGVINSAIEHNKQGEEVWVIGVDADQYKDGIYTNAEGVEESVVLTSAMKHTGNGVQTVLNEYFTNGMQSGSVTLGYSDYGVGLPATNPNLEEELVNEAYASLEETLLEGELPTTPEDTTESISTVNIEGELK